MTVTEVGATLRSYAVGEVEVVDGFALDEPSSGGRGQILVPWPNRLEGGEYSFEGRVGRAALDEPALGNAIHGLARWLPWRAISRQEDEVVLSCVLHPQPGYPWRLALEVEYRLGIGGLTVVLRASNLSDVPAPFGVGFHPYVTVGTELLDDARLTIPARRRLISDDRGLPTAEEAVAGTTYDFMATRAIGPMRLDTAFTDLARDFTGQASVRLMRPDGERYLEVWMDQNFGYVMVYSADQVEPATRRRRGIAIEPMTCPPNAFRTGPDVIRLEPGVTWSGTWGIRPG